MRLLSVSTITFLLFSLSTSGQTRAITGKIIDEYLIPMPYVRIENSDSSLLATTDVNGQFKIDIPITEKSLLIILVGHEWASINLTSNCDQLEIILMNHSSYDFISLKKADRLRRKRFNKLPEVHLAAYKKRIFTMDKACYTQNFIPSYSKENK